MPEPKSPRTEEDRKCECHDRTTLGLCVHAHCPLDGPHWHGGIWRSGHIREHAIPAEQNGDADG